MALHSQKRLCATKIKLLCMELVHLFRSGGTDKGERNFPAMGAELEKKAIISIGLSISQAEKPSSNNVGR